MDLIAYFRVLRRRWTLVVIPAVGAILLGWLTAPAAQQTTGPVATSYSATATLITGTSLDPGQTPIDLPIVVLFSSLGEVPKRAAKTLKYDGEPQVLASLVTVTAVPDTGTLTILSSDVDPDAVTKRVNAFAEAITSYFKDKQDGEAQSRINALNKLLSSTTKSIREVQAQISRQGKDPVLDAQLSALQTEYSAEYGEVQELKRRLGGEGPIQILQPGVAIPQQAAGFAAPRNPLIRLGLAGLMGALLGAALALVVERVDQRLRTRGQVEDEYGVPVLAEIPLSYAPRREVQEISSAVRPASAIAESYRSLRSALMLTSPQLAGLDSSRGDATSGGYVAVVTSAVAGEGRSTTVANLAAVLAESGRSVIVLSMDLRNPRVHEAFGVWQGTGLAELLAADRGSHLDEVLRDTNVPGVRLANSGRALEHAGALLVASGPMIARARELADVVLIDAPPVLAVADALDIARHCDAVLLVTRLNRTTTMRAAAARRLLDRLHVRAIGTVVIGGGAQTAETSRPVGVSGRSKENARSSAPADALAQVPGKGTDKGDK